MSNPEEHNHLKKLLKNSSSEGGKKSVDDFEREALEGFESLESEQEALDLKAELDEKIRSEVFFEKRSGVRVYWLAAAALFLVIGLSVLFVVNNNVLDSQKNMALNKTETTEEKPEGLKQETTPINNPPKAENAAPPAEENEKAKVDAVTATGKAQAEQKNQSVGAMGATAEPSAFALSAGTKPAKDSKADEVFDNKDADKKPALMDLSPLEKQAEKDRDQAGAGDDANLTNDLKTGKTANLKTEERKEKESPAQNKPMDADELKKEDKSSRAKSRKKGTSKAPDYAESNNQTVATKNNLEISAETEGYKQTLDEEITREDAAKKESVKALPTSPSISSPDNARNNNAGPGANVTQICFYSGGEVSLVKDVNERLSAKNLNKKFDAVIYFNTKKEIEKVKITNGFDMKKEEESAVENILKTLNKFYFTATPSKATEYKLQYRP